MHIFLNSLISWWSKKWSVVARSSNEPSIESLLIQLLKFCWLYFTNRTQFVTLSQMCTVTISVPAWYECADLVSSVELSHPLDFLNSVLSSECLSHQWFTHSLSSRGQECWCIILGNSSLAFAGLESSRFSILNSLFVSFKLTNYNRVASSVIRSRTSLWGIILSLKSTNN